MVRVENVFFFSGYIFFKNRGGHVGGVTKNRTVQGGEGWRQEIVRGSCICRNK